MKRKTLTEWVIMAAMCVIVAWSGCMFIYSMAHPELTQMEIFLLFTTGRVP